MNRAARANRAAKDLPQRNRKLAREMVVFWKKYERQLGDAQKRAEKEAVERRKLEVQYI